MSSISGMLSPLNFPGLQPCGGTGGSASGGFGGRTAGGTGVSAAKPSPAEAAAQIRKLATQAGSQAFSAVTSVLDPMYHLYQSVGKRDPSLADKVSDWVVDTSRRMQDNATKNAQKFIDTYADGAKKVADIVAPGSSKIITDLLRNPKDLFV